MKILLLNPPNRKTLIGNNPSFLDDSRGCNPPLGIMYIASYLLKHTHHRVELWDCQVQGNPDHKLLFGNYDVVGITATTFTLLDVVDLIVKTKRYSKAKVIVGGTHPTIYPEETLDLGADAVIQGEGEETFPTMIKKLANLSKMISEQIKPIQDLDDLPFPLRQNINKYNSVFSNGMATTIFSSRGCPFNCRFCYRPVMGRICRYRSAGNVVAEIEECYRRGIKDYLFYDDTFTVNKTRAVEICRLLRKAKLKIRFDVRSRVDCLDKVLLKELKQAGMFQIHLGVESGVQRILDRMNKGIKLEQVEQAFKLCRTIGIKTLAYIMIGCPDETLEDITTTRQFVKKLNPDYLHATVFTPFPATDFYLEWVERYGVDVWKGFAGHPTAGFIPPVWGNISREQLSAILIDIYREFYVRGPYIIRKLFEVRSVGRLKKYVRAGLNMWRAK